MVKALNPIAPFTYPTFLDLPPTPQHTHFLTFTHHTTAAAATTPTPQLPHVGGRPPQLHHESEEQERGWDDLELVSESPASPHVYLMLSPDQVHHVTSAAHVMGAALV